MIALPSFHSHTPSPSLPIPSFIPDASRFHGKDQTHPSNQKTHSSILYLILHSKYSRYKYIENIKMYIYYFTMHICPPHGLQPWFQVRYAYLCIYELNHIQVYIIYIVYTHEFCKYRTNNPIHLYIMQACMHVFGCSVHSWSGIIIIFLFLHTNHSIPLSHLPLSTEIYQGKKNQPHTKFRAILDTNFCHVSKKKNETKYSKMRKCVVRFFFILIRRHTCSLENICMVQHSRH